MSLLRSVKGATTRLVSNFGIPGQPGSPGPIGGAAPRAISALAVGIDITNTAAQNTSAYAAWRDNNSYIGWTLLFDKIGTYAFNAQINIPVFRTLKGVGPGVTLRYDGPVLTGGAGKSFITSWNGSVLTIEDMTVNVNNGADYGLEFASYTGSAGPTAFVHRVSVQNALVSNIFGRNNSWELADVMTVGGPTGIEMIGCSECCGTRVSCVLHTLQGFKLVGSHHAGAAPNGCRWNLYSVVMGVPGQYGLVMDGVAQTGVYGITCEGATQSTILITGNSSNIRIHGARSNAGDLVRFDGCNNAIVTGGCVSTQKVKYLNNARKCRAFLDAESAAAPVDIVQEFGALAWRAWIRSNGDVFALDNVPPIDGFWEYGDRVYRSLPAVGQPLGWVCRLPGNPGTWVAMPNL